MFVSLIKKIGTKLSLNDPRWGSKDDNKYAQEGKKPGDGPPDLEQIWRDFNQRLSAFMGQKKRPDSGPGQGSGGGSPPDMKGAGVAAGAVGAVAFVIWIASGAFTVQEGQAGIVMTFGKYSHTALPGFNMRWPSPFQSHEIVNVSQVRTVEIGYRSSVSNKQLKESLMLTEDENIIDIQFAVQYTLKDPVNWLFTNREQEETVRQVAETSIREIVGRSKMDFVLYEGREKVAFDVQKLMQEILDRYELGAQITNVTMQGVQPPEQVQGAFDDAVKAGQDRERMKNEGEAYANDVIPKATGAAFRLLAEAEAYRSLVTENAVGNASRFQQVLVEYQKAPGVTRDRMYLETMQQVFTSASKVMIDAKSGSNLLYLPLDKLMAQTAAGDVKTSSTPPAAILPPELVESVRPRDSRSRETSRDREIR
ncbi:MAG: membrane protease subunit HflK [Janthinobacterium sp.]|jgi:membrane protease subunit HflK